MHGKQRQCHLLLQENSSCIIRISLMTPNKCCLTTAQCPVCTKTAKTDQPIVGRLDEKGKGCARCSSCFYWSWLPLWLYKVDIGDKTRQTDLLLTDLGVPLDWFKGFCLPLFPSSDSIVTAKLWPHCISFLPGTFIPRLHGTSFYRLV